MIELEETVVVVGASVAGITAVEELSRLGHRGPVILIDAEDGASYARPPLSKAVLTGAASPESTLLPELDCPRVQYLRGDAAAELNVEKREIKLASGRAVAYGGLVIATGSRARTLVDLGRNATGIKERVVRSLDDACQLRAVLQEAKSIVIVGGGVLGMEIASVAAGLGLHTTVATDEPPLLSHCGTFVSRLVAQQAEAHGVSIRIHPDGARLVDRAGRLAVHIADTVLEADIVVSAVGDVPNVEWLQSSPLRCRPGVVIDSRCRVSDRIVAAGDVAAFGEPPRRTPHWSNAIDQARVAAAALLLGDAAIPHVPRPYFWTDQFSLAMKMGGRMPFRGEPLVVEGSVAKLDALVHWTQGGNPNGALAINKRIPISRLHRVAGNPLPTVFSGATQ
ncbi:NAD(P)/FAD-dependent oxidoreductase [Mycobacterium sp. 4858]|uniref:NAD(P)/FAD-dependent oxidoreductase n=1 Tax=Mycobacterium sp. 4858 TaxID=2057185 RepID=UPI000C828A78|nr:FAD-dependent oxidoreductase [Mycobacterium sp. 4858]